MAKVGLISIPGTERALIHVVTWGLLSDSVSERLFDLTVAMTATSEGHYRSSEHDSTGSI